MMVISRPGRKRQRLLMREKLHDRFCTGFNEKRNNLFSEARLTGRPAHSVFLLAQSMPDEKKVQG
ncbi:hypothetical protein [Chlorobaculum tepidum]|uniref:hypothetical protein n=1 Tax=Chlorobaculum tepidum TaxID=1097 RepID=UPI0013E8F19A|nr:hypothetical protein [Chlorobaculum tepidum]